MNVRFPEKKEVPKAKVITRPVAGSELLRYFKDRKTLAPLCDILRVEYKLARDGYPTHETLMGIMEALIHQIRARDHSIRILLDRLYDEMRQSRHPLTTKEEWERFKLFEGFDTKGD